MGTIFKLNKKIKTNKQIFQIIIEIKSIIDTIIENKNLENDHDLCLASKHLDNFLNILEEQNFNK